MRNFLLDGLSWAKTSSGRSVVGSDDEISTGEPGVWRSRPWRSSSSTLCNFHHAYPVQSKTTTHWSPAVLWRSGAQLEYAIHQSRTQPACVWCSARRISPSPLEKLSTPCASLDVVLDSQCLLILLFSSFFVIEQKCLLSHTHTHTQKDSPVLVAMTELSTSLYLQPLHNTILQ